MPSPAEIESLKARRSNIPAQQIAMRAALCRALDSRRGGHAVRGRAAPGARGGARLGGSGGTAAAQLRTLAARPRRVLRTGGRVGRCEAPRGPARLLPGAPTGAARITGASSRLPGTEALGEAGLGVLRVAGARAGPAVSTWRAARRPSSSGARPAPSPGPARSRHRANATRRTTAIASTTAAATCPAGPTRPRSPPSNPTRAGSRRGSATSGAASADWWTGLGTIRWRCAGSVPAIASPLPLPAKAGVQSGARSTVQSERPFKQRPGLDADNRE